MLARCTSSLDLHMLIVPFWYLFRTLLVPKVALGLLQGNGRFGVTNDVRGVSDEITQLEVWSPETYPNMRSRPITVRGIGSNADDVDSVSRYGHILPARLVRDLDAREARLRHVEPRQLPQQQQPAPARHMVIAIGSFLQAD